MDPILETHRVTKEGLISLPCRAMHKVSPRSVKIKENDALYDIYARCMNRSISFIREWLKLFFIMRKAQLAKKAKQYLKSKGLSVDTWLESITDSRKGDVLVLFRLNLLMATHCLVHLANGQIWTTLATLSGVHSTDLQKCDMHLAYIRGGLFIELTECAVPLVIVEITESITSLVIGELSATEECTIEDVMKTGLGVGLSHPIPEEQRITKQVPSASAAKKEDLPCVELELKETPFKDPLKYVNVSHTPHVIPDSTDKPALLLDTESKADTSLTKSVPIQPNLTHDTSTPEIKDFSVNVLKLTVKPGETSHTSNELLATYPLSKFRPPGYYPITTQDTNQESIALNMTEFYWLIDLDKADCTITH